MCGGDTAGDTFLANANAALTAVPLDCAGIVQGLCEGVAKYCPTAWVGIISNPVNSTVPIAAEIFKRAGAKCARLHSSPIVQQYGRPLRTPQPPAALCSHTLRTVKGLC